MRPSQCLLPKDLHPNVLLNGILGITVKILYVQAVLFMVFIIYCSENKLELSIWFGIEFIIHILLDFYIAKTGIQNSKCILLNILRHVAALYAAYTKQLLAGQRSPAWLWLFLGWHFMTVEFDVINQMWILMLLNMAQGFGCFYIVYFVAGFSVIESIIIIGICTSSATINFTFLYFLKRYDIEIHKIFERTYDQYMLLTSVCDSISDILFRVNKDYIIDFSSNCALGKPAKYAGKPFWNVFKDEESKERAKYYLDQAFKTKKRQSWTVHNKKTSKYKTYTASPIIKADDVTAVTVSCSDITDKVVAEQRGIEVEKAKTRSNTKTQFIASLSHELRNPIQSIMYSIQLISLTQLSKMQREYIDTILESCKILTALIGDVLDISKIEEGRIELEKSPMNVLSLVETLGETFYSMAHSKGLELFTLVDPKIPFQCLGDSTRVSQVLNNFVSNAIKFTRMGYILISAESIKNTNEDVTILFKCIDTGVGIPEEEQKNIFQRYVQLQRRQGWGLGLAISQNLVRIMNGKIGLKSKLGEGSTFWFSCSFKLAGHYVPICSCEFPPDREVVVYIENAIFRGIVTRYLESLKYERVNCATSPSELEIVLASSSCKTIIITEEKGIQHFYKFKSKIQKIILICNLLDQNVQTFYKDIPVIKLKKPLKFQKLVDALNDQESSNTPHASVSKDFKQKNISILLAEDNMLLQTLVKKLLQQHGIKQIVCANNGKEAVELVQNAANPFSLILMDIQMPVMDGIEATQCIRHLSDPRKSNIPIIAASADAMIHTKEVCINAGMNDVLGKPIDKETLLRTIQKYVLK